jgi:hypothetical protein
MTLTQRVMSFIVAAAFASIVSVSLLMFWGVASRWILFGVPVAAGVAGFVWGDRGIMVVLRWVGAAG